MLPNSVTDALYALTKILDGRSAVTVTTNSLGKTIIRVETR